MNEGFRSITVFLALIIGAQEFEWTDTSYAAYWGTPVVTYSAGEFPDRMPGTDKYTPYARSRVYCHEGGRAVIYLRNGEPESVRLEEYAHAFDCRDNGVVDGSPGHPMPAVCTAFYICDNPAEWYASEVVRTGRLR
jgi:hypothetical protein